MIHRPQTAGVPKAAVDLGEGLAEGGHAGACIQDEIRRRSRLTSVTPKS